MDLGDGRPEAEIFLYGSKIRSTDSYESSEPVDYDARKKIDGFMVKKGTSSAFYECGILIRGDTNLEYIEVSESAL